MSADKITPNDIKTKLADIQTDATATVEGTKNQLLAVGAGLAILLVIVAFFFGRKAGVHKSTIIEVKRA